MNVGGEAGFLNFFIPPEGSETASSGPVLFPNFPFFFSRSFLFSHIKPSQLLCVSVTQSALVCLFEPYIVRVDREMVAA